MSGEHKGGGKRRHLRVVGSDGDGGTPEGLYSVRADAPLAGFDQQDEARGEVLTELEVRKYAKDLLESSTVMHTEDDAQAGENFPYKINRAFAFVAEIAADTTYPGGAVQTEDIEGFVERYLLNMHDRDGRVPASARLADSLEMLQQAFGLVAEDPVAGGLDRGGLATFKGMYPGGFWADTTRADIFLSGVDKAYALVGTNAHFHDISIGDWFAEIRDQVIMDGIGLEDIPSTRAPQATIAAYEASLRAVSERAWDSWRRGELIGPVDEDQ